MPLWSEIKRYSTKFHMDLFPYQKSITNTQLVIVMLFLLFRHRCHYDLYDPHNVEGQHKVGVCQQILKGCAVNHKQIP